MKSKLGNYVHTAGDYPANRNLVPYVNSINIVGTYEVDDLGTVTGLTYGDLARNTASSDWSKYSLKKGKKNGAVSIS